MRGAADGQEPVAGAQVRARDLGVRTAVAAVAQRAKRIRAWFISNIIMSRQIIIQSASELSSYIIIPDFGSEWLSCNSHTDRYSRLSNACRGRSVDG